MKALFVGCIPNSLGPIKKNLPNFPRIPLRFASFSLIRYDKGYNIFNQAFWIGFIKYYKFVIIITNKLKLI